MRSQIEIFRRNIERSTAVKPHVPRLRSSGTADVALINLNLMLARTDGTFDQQCYIPLGLLSIAGVLEQHGFEVDLIDYQLFSHARYFDAERFVDSIGEVPRIVGISCMSNLLPFSVVVARTIKKKFPNAFVVLGGVGPSPVADQLLEAFDFIDCVVEGEGELTMLDIARGSRERRPKSRVVADLNELPIPAYHLIDFSNYDAAPSIVTSRGCPYQCTFCTEPYNFSHSVRFRSVDQILSELNAVHARSGRNLFLFQDDILPLKPSRFDRLIKGFSTLEFPMQWKCFSRTDLMTSRLLDVMPAAGCVQIRYGIESGSNRTLKTLKKGFDIEQAFRVAAESAKKFPSVHCSFMWGFPFEAPEDARATLEWIRRFEDAGVSCLLFQYSPLPGSPLYRSTNTRPLRFDRSKYSIFVLSGHEDVRDTTFVPTRTSSELFDLIETHPSIFAGFYHYDSELVDEVHELISAHQVFHRTHIKNEYDL